MQVYQKIQCFQINSDFGTSGLPGANTCEVSSNQSRLIKKSDTSDKDNSSDDSYDTGKFASYVLSRLRRIFLSLKRTHR